jgi:prepilin-type processing-associated H-X9-DG protein
LYVARWITVQEQIWLPAIAQGPGIVKSDYAASSGDAQRISGDSLYRPPNYAGIRPDQWTPTNVCKRTGVLLNDRNVPNCQSGVMFYRSEVKISQISDGTTNTYMVGEKWMPLDGYDGTLNLADPGFTYGDNQSMYTGYESDNHRAAWFMNIFDPAAANPSTQEDSQPLQDRAGVADLRPEVRWFGSIHSSSFHMLFCDGSVHSIGYDIAPVTHSRLAHRYDGEVAGIEEL